MGDPELYRFQTFGTGAPFRKSEMIGKSIFLREKPSAADTRTTSLPCHSLAPPLSPGNSPDFRQKRLGQRSDIKKRGKGHLPGKHRRFCSQLRHFSRKQQLFGMYQPAAMANAPAIPEQAMLHRFAHGLTPEQHGFDGDEFGGCVEIGFQPAGQRRAVEKNGFLRQPVQPGARPCGNAGGDGGGSGGCLVDLLAGLRRHHQRGAGSGNSLPFHFISAGQSAGGVDEDGLDLVGKRIRQADLGATFLE